LQEVKPLPPRSTYIPGSEAVDREAATARINLASGGCVEGEGVFL
jgi:hypothetical protein